MMFNKGGKLIRKYSQMEHIALLFFVSMLIVSIPCSSADQAFSARDLTYITEQFPPYNYQEDGKLQGVSVDLLDKAWESMGVNLNRSVIQFLPWRDGYQQTLDKTNTILFSTARLPQREQLFKWAGPIGPIRNVLLAKRDKNISITAPEDLEKYRIGAINDDSAFQMLLDKGMKKENLVLETTSSPIIEMLQNGSIDAWAYGDVAGFWLIQESGANSSDFKIVYEFGQTDYYYAFNKETPDSLVQSFQQALDNAKNNTDEDEISDYERILSKYIPVMCATNITEENRALAFLNEAVAYANDNGIDKALQEFNNRSGSFVRGDLYIFAYDFNGTNIAHPIRPDLIGQNGLLDTNGVDVISRELALAKRGGGVMYLVFPNPIHEDKDELKLIYIKNINNSLYLGTGLYLSNISSYFGEEDRVELMTFVEEALRFAHKNGKAKALEVFNDPKGNFTREGRYIFAYDYDGRTLALPYQPELIGASRIDVKDPNGVEINQQATDAAKFGNGFFYYIYPDRSKNMNPALKLGYVVDVDGTWYLGSGIYADSNQEND